LWANRFPAWTCLCFHNKSSQLLIPSHSPSVGNVIKLKMLPHPSACLLPTVCQLHEPWSRRDEEPVSVSVSLSVRLTVCEPALSDYPGSGSRWHGEQVTITQLPQRNPRWASSVVYICFFLLPSLINCSCASCNHETFTFRGHRENVPFLYMLCRIFYLTN